MRRLRAGATILFLSLSVSGLCVTAGPADESGQGASVVDFNSDRIVDFRDCARLARSWHTVDPLVEVAPMRGDGSIDAGDLLVLADFWLQEIPEPIFLTWIGHASVRIAWEDKVVYVDPRRIVGTPRDATAILVTHSHSDHYSPVDIAKVTKPGTRFLGPADVVQAYGSGQVILPGQTMDAAGLPVTGVAAYNLITTNHPKANNWLGFVVQCGGRRIYVAGDTDLTPEMKALENIDVAFLPAGGTYTFDAAGAAEATKYLKPLLAIPYHWGEIVGTLADAQRFATLAACNVKVMTPGEVLSSDDWQKDFSLAAYWRLDETEGAVAADSAGTCAGTVAGGAVWQPVGGRIGGAILLDGVDGCIRTPFVLDPGAGSFSVFAWVKGGAPGQAILSQAGGVSWVMADGSTGALMTQLKESGRKSRDLVSSAVITDGRWHHVGLTWDGTNRVLYVDGTEVARDTQNALVGGAGGLCLGTALVPGSFWSGLIDEVRLHRRAVAP